MTNALGSAIIGDQFLISQRATTIHSHFPEPVMPDAVRFLGNRYERRVRLLAGTLDEAILLSEEAPALLGQKTYTTTEVYRVDAEKLRLLVESARIRLAYAHDRHFAVSLSGIRILPRRFEAAYLRMLPQSRLRLVLATNPGAGKTIMARLLMKQMIARGDLQRCLVVCPHSLAEYWQDELYRRFLQPFEILNNGKLEAPPVPIEEFLITCCRKLATLSICFKEYFDYSSQKELLL